MQDLVRPAQRERGRTLLAATVLFLLVAPFSVDTFNSLTNRAFLDLLKDGNPYTLAPSVELQFRGETARLEWPYPPLAILVVLPAWLAYQLTGSEAIYQLLFKLPLFGGVIVAAILSGRLAVDAEARASITRRLLLNPGVLLLATVSGGFDAILMGLLIATYYLLVYGPRPWASATCLGLGIGLRLYPAVVLPAIMLWLYRREGGRAATHYAAVTLAGAAMTLLPALLDLSGFLSTLASVGNVGPFSIAWILNMVLHKVLPSLWPALMEGHRPEDLSTAVMGLLTAVALVSVCGLVFRRRIELLPAMLAALLVFYALYPKMHPLYVLALYPLALLAPCRLPSWVWAPGVVWYLLFNGAFGATGLPYLLAPLTGHWTDMLRLLGLPEGRWRDVAIWWPLIATYVGMTLWSAWTLLHGPVTRDRAGSARC